MGVKTTLQKTFAVLCTAALIGTAVPALSASAQGTISATTTANLNVRKGAGTNYAVMKVLSKNTAVTIVDTSVSGWLKVRFSDGTTGYCSANYLNIVTDAVTTGRVNLRKGAGTNYAVIRTTTKNTKVDVLKIVNSSWASVKLSDGTTGYMSTQYLSFLSSNVNTSVAAVPTTITLSENTKRMPVGRCSQLSVSYNQGTVTWQSSDTSVASVSPSGMVSALKAGTATITATDSKTQKTAKCVITAVKTEYTALTISETAKTVTIGQSFQLRATANNGSQNIRWRTSNSSILRVDNTGKVTTVGVGTAYITAYDPTGTVTAACRVTVQNKDSISLSASSVTINAGSSTYVTANKANASMQVVWSSSNENVAAVHNGRISGLSAGTAVITASNPAGTVYARCTVKVNSVYRGNVSVSRSAVTTTAGKTVYIKGYNGSTWGSSDTNVATVWDGFIEAKTPGKAAITYTDRSGNRAICVITVKQAEPVKFAYSSPNSATLNQNVSLVAITDKTITDVYFTVKLGSKTVQVNASQKTAEGNTYVWKGNYKTTEAGTFKLTAYAKRNGQWSTCSDGVSDVYVTSKTNHTQTGLSRLRASDELIRFIGEKEGFVSGITYDRLANNLPTIAHGYVVWEGGQFYNNLTRTEGYALLVDAVNNEVYTSRVNQMLIDNNIRFNQQQFDALVSFTYNLGTGWTYSSTLKNILLNSYGTVTTNSNTLTATVTANSGLNLRESPSSSAKSLAVLSKGETVTLVSGTKYNSVWYQVKTNSGKTGYCSSSHLNVSTGGKSTVRDLNYINRSSFINQMLSYHHASGVCYYGLLYRRVDEVEMFLYGDYVSDGRSNKHSFPSPSCLHF